MNTSKSDRRGVFSLHLIMFTFDYITRRIKGRQFAWLHLISLKGGIKGRQLAWLHLISSKGGYRLDNSLG